jgi:hypothetical protein
VQPHPAAPTQQAPETRAQPAQAAPQAHNMPQLNQQRCRKDCNLSAQKTARLGRWPSVGIVLKLIDLLPKRRIEKPMGGRDRRGICAPSSRSHQMLASDKSKENRLLSKINPSSQNMHPTIIISASSMDGDCAALFSSLEDPSHWWTEIQ